MNRASNEIPTFTILVKAGGNRVEGVSIDSVNETDVPDKHESKVNFITKQGKRWSMRLSEFSIIFPSTQPSES